MLETCYTFFRILWFNKKLKKHSIYLKYYFCNNICWKAWGQYIYIFLKKLVFIQQSFAKFIETVVKIYIVRKHSYFE